MSAQGNSLGGRGPLYCPVGRIRSGDSAYSSSAWAIQPAVLATANDRLARLRPHTGCHRQHGQRQIDVGVQLHLTCGGRLDLPRRRQHRFGVRQFAQYALNSASARGSWSR